MAKKKFRDKAGDAMLEADAAKALVDIGASLLKRGAEAGIVNINEKIEDNKTLIEIPELYSKDFILTLEEATRWLEEDGLKVRSVVAKPDINYKDCKDTQVVDSNPKLKQKVKPGTRVILQYVTTEVIEDSKKLFNESEKLKADKADKKAAQAAKNKETLNEAVANVKQSVENVISKISKKESTESKTIDHDEEE